MLSISARLLGVLTLDSFPLTHLVSGTVFILDELELASVEAVGHLEGLQVLRPPGTAGTLRYHTRYPHLPQKVHLEPGARKVGLPIIQFLAPKSNWLVH